MEESLFGTVNEFEWDGTRYIAVDKSGCLGCDFRSQCKEMHGTAVGCTLMTRPDGRDVIWVKAQPSKTKPEKAIRVIESYISCLEQGSEPDFTLDEVVNALKRVVQLAKTNFKPTIRIN